MLLKTRTWLLQTYVSVSVATDLKSFSELVERSSFQVAILCHTLTPEERQQATEILTRRSKETRIACLTPASGNWKEISTSQGCTMVESTAAGFLVAIVPMLRGSTAAVCQR